MSENPILTEAERAELERLRAENAALRAQLGQERTRDTEPVPEAAPVARRRWRTIVATLLIVRDRLSGHQRSSRVMPPPRMSPLGEARPSSACQPSSSAEQPHRRGQQRFHQRHSSSGTRSSMRLVMARDPARPTPDGANPRLGTCRPLRERSTPSTTGLHSRGLTDHPRESPSCGEVFQDDLVAEGLELSDGSLASTVGVAADEVVATQIGVVTVVGEVASCRRRRSRR
jgi:hypothetical protein